MKVEHITLGGRAVIRDTSTILPITRQKLSAIQLSYESRLVIVPALLPLKIKITATYEGAAFDVMKNDRLAVLNVCCFEAQHTKSALSVIRSLGEQYNKIGIPFKVVEPVTPQWLYSAIIDPRALDPHQMMTAGEVELYIFEQLYVSYTKYKSSPEGERTQNAIHSEDKNAHN